MARDIEKHRAYTRLWRAEHREHLREYHRAYEKNRRGERSWSKYNFPLTLVCKECEEPFVLTERPTKTGPLSLYCSPACRLAFMQKRDKFWHTKRKYGLSPDAYDAMLVEQGGRCACCGEPFSGPTKDGKRSVCVDHCHKTGRVRGLLCSGCNVAIGKFEKRGHWILAYLKERG